MKYKWFVEDGHIFSEEVVPKRASGHQGAKEFMVRTSIAFNVGEEVAQHIVELHNQSLVVCEGNDT